MTIQKCRLRGRHHPFGRVHTFYLDSVSENGDSSLFTRDTSKVSVLANELFSLVTPWILFSFHSPRALRLFAKAFAAHTAPCTQQIELHVEINLGATTDAADRRLLASWTEGNEPHGRNLDVHTTFESCMLAVRNFRTKRAEIA